MRIEICGGIASGKTSLASLLSKNEFGIPNFEDFQKNPFWEAFYKNPNRNIFETELTFTLQHYHQIKNSNDDELTICDFSLLIDKAYANLGLNGKRLDLYNEVYEELLSEIGHADLYIFLECGSNEELSRIKDRGRDIESEINSEFLKSLNQSLYQVLKKEISIQVLKINSEQLDFVNNCEDSQHVISLIKNRLNNLKTN